MTLRSLIPLALLGLGAPAFASEIAHVDADAIILSMPAYEKAKAEVTAHGKSLQAALAAEEAAMQDFYEQTMRKVQAGQLSPAEQQKAEVKMSQMQADLKKHATEADASLLAKEEELTRPMHAAVQKALADVAKKKGYDYIFDSNVLLFANGPDATEDVKKALATP